MILLIYFGGFFKMKKIIFTLLTLVFCFLVVSCGPIMHQKGDKFSENLWAKGKNPDYVKSGVYEGKDFYVLQPDFIGTHNNYGLLVSNGFVYQVLSENDVVSINRNLQGGRLKDNLRNAQSVDESRSICRNKVNEILKYNESLLVGNKPSSCEGYFTYSNHERNLVDDGMCHLKNCQVWVSNVFHEYKRLQREDELKSKKAAEREKLANLNREKCLSNGDIGICQSSKQNELMFLCDSNPIVALNNLGNQYCYTTDNFNIVTNMLVRNNTSGIVRDITFTCQQIANSGTVLGQGSQTVYDAWKPGEVRTVKLKFVKVDQVKSMNCIPSRWKN